MNTLKKTLLYELYEEFGAKTVPFGGWDMPVQFTGIIAEHEAVRTRAGLFDVSHMGEFEVSGPDVRAFLQQLMTNDVTKLSPGQALYSPMTYPTGGCVDDLLVYCFSETRFWIVVNAGNITKDWAWIVEHKAQFDVDLHDISDEVVLLALQGPMAKQILQPLTDVALDSLKSYHFTEGFVSGIGCVISRTGYTGEDGFELYVQADHGEALWRALWQAGQPMGLQACGLGCRDTLRLEARLPLYGHELSEDISPLEAGLNPFVKLDKGSFIGREALLRQKESGLERKLVGIQVLERGIPRAEYLVYDDDKQVGFLTSGTMSPTLKVPIGLALVSAHLAAIDTPLSIDIRGKRVAAIVVKTPFYRRSKA